MALSESERKTKGEPRALKPFDRRTRTSTAFKLSVVIPTCDRPQLLQRCLRALLTQEDIEGPIEILVVDDARSPLSGPPVREYVCRSGIVEVRYLQPPPGHKGPAAARNTGWLAARSPIIAFTDDDTVPSPTWLAEGVRSLTPGLTATWGWVEVPMPDQPTDAQRNVGGLHGAEFVTANCFVRRDALVMVGGFDERFKRPWREDSDLYFSLLEAGFKVASAPAAIVEHPARAARPATCVKQHKNMLFEALLYKKHPRLYRQKISSGPPARYYFATLMFALTWIGLAIGSTPLAAIGTAGWLGFSAWLSAQRLQGTSHDWLNVIDIAFSSIMIPVIAVFWRLAGAVRYRVLFA